MFAGLAGCREVYQGDGELIPSFTLPLTFPR